MALLEIILVAVLAVVVIFLVGVYNSLVVLRNRIKNAESQIDVQLKRRFDLIPNLVETVKGYAKHEKELFENVTKARTAMMNAQSVGEKSKADNMMSATLKSLFAVAENYPKLVANENFKMLQEELAGTESKIAYSRQFFNDTVLMYNNKLQLFPTNIVANLFGFKDGEFFQAPAGEKEAVKVKF